MTPATPDPSLPGRLREFHARLPLAGDPPNAVLALPDDRLLYLAAVLRDTPVPAPALKPEEWQAFLDSFCRTESTRSSFPCMSPFTSPRRLELGTQWYPGIG